jgi:hypothetical protein
MAPAMGREIWVSDQRMEPGMERPHRGKQVIAAPSRAAFSALLFLLCWMAFLLAVDPVQAEEKDMVLPESGIHYPGGFDPNTVGEVLGKAHGYFQPESGPVRFQLISTKETYTILVSPAWYQRDLEKKISDGTEVRVQGSKSLGKDGKLYIIAQKIKILSSGETMAFRNEDGYPLWKGSTGTPGGFGSPSRGMGGMGRGRR